MPAHEVKNIIWPIFENQKIWVMRYPTIRPAKAAVVSFADHKALVRILDPNAVPDAKFDLTQLIQNKNQHDIHGVYAFPDEHTAISEWNRLVLRRIADTDEQYDDNRNRLRGRLIPDKNHQKQEDVTMMNTKIWIGFLSAKMNEAGGAAAIAVSDSLQYPENGSGVFTDTFGSETGDIRDIAGALVHKTVNRAFDNQVETIQMVTDVDLYREMSHVEHIMGITVHFNYVGDLYPLNAADPNGIRRDIAVTALARELDKLSANAGLITFDAPPLVAGQYVLREAEGQFDIGRVERVDGGNAVVWFADEAVTASVPVEDLRILRNGQTILRTSLGGDAIRRMSL